MKKNLAVQTILLLALAFFSCHKECDKANTDPDIKGCGDFIVAKIIAEDKILEVWIDRNKIAYSTHFQTFENVATEGFATVKIYQNCNIDAIWYSVCNDIFQAPGCPSAHWSLQKGKLSFKVSKVPTAPACSDFYMATVILENAEFKKDSSSETQLIDRIELKNVQVGRCAG
jgi:hypothetical protein